MLRILLLCILLSNSTALAESDVTIDDIEAAWEARRAKVQSFEATLKEERVIFQGSLNGIWGSDPDYQGDLPREDTTTNVVHKFIASPNGLRMETEGTRFNASDAKVFRRKATIVKRDQITTRLSDYGSNQDSTYQYQAGIYQKPIFFTEGRFAPLYRLVERKYSFIEKVKRYTIEQQAIVENRRPCVLFTRGSSKLWFDRDRNYVLVRQDYGDRHRLEIEYQKNEIVGWLPTSWTLKSYSNTPPGTPKDFTQIELVDIQFNKTYPDELFQIEFPAGTHLYDTTLEGLSGKFASFIVQPDGFRLPAYLAKPKKAKGGKDTIEE